MLLASSSRHTAAMTRTPATRKRQGYEFNYLLTITTMALIPSSGTAAGTKLITKLSYGQALKSRGRNIHVKRSHEFNQNSYPTTYDCLNTWFSNYVGSESQKVEGQGRITYRQQTNKT